MAQIRRISQKRFYQSPDFLLLVPIGSQKYKKILIFSYFHISTYGHIWLNHIREDSHFGYIAKLEKETLVR